MNPETVRWNDGLGRTPEVRGDSQPVRELRRAKEDVFATEAVSTVLGSIVDQVVSEIQVLVVRENQALVSRLTQVRLYPE